MKRNSKKPVVSGNAIQSGNVLKFSSPHVERLKLLKEVQKAKLATLPENGISTQVLGRFIESIDKQLDRLK